MGKVEVIPKLRPSADNSTKSDGPEHDESRFTICSPQLLHLGQDGRPLWFNGWILPNKFSHDDHQQPAHFEAFISEPREPQNADSWKLEKDNICCLFTDHVSPFTRQEQEILENVVRIAGQVGAV
jgi:hypothetical protein